MENFAQRLLMARTMKGWSMQDLANRLEGTMSKSAIAKYENGQRVPGKEKLIALCQVLEVKLDFFSRQKSVRLEPSFRKLDKLPKQKQEEIVERTRDYLERYLETEELTASEQLFKNKIKSFVCDSLDKAESAAELFRQKMKLGDNPLSNIIEQLEDWGIKVFHEELGTDSISGMSSWQNSRESIIVINKSQNIDRQRFTALHEVAHGVLNLSDNLSDREKEKICDRFAGAMLIPASKLIAELGQKRSRIHLKELELIKLQYGISVQALLYRAKELGIITNYMQSFMMRYIKEQFGRYAVIGNYDGIEASNRLLQILCKGIAEDAITTSKAASLYGKSLSSFRKELNSSVAV